MSMWSAEMHTEHYDFISFGDSKTEAQSLLRDAFYLHLHRLHRADPDVVQWPSFDDCGTDVTEHYDVTYHEWTWGASRDGATLIAQPGVVCRNCGEAITVESADNGHFWAHENSASAACTTGYEQKYAEPA